MAEGIWRILTRAAESLKICTFMGYFCRKYVMFECRGVVSWKMTYGFKKEFHKEFDELVVESMVDHSSV